jgi:hypothetical protein
MNGDDFMVNPDEMYNETQDGLRRRHVRGEQRGIAERDAAHMYRDAHRTDHVDDGDVYGDEFSSESSDTSSTDVSYEHPRRWARARGDGDVDGSEGEEDDFWHEPIDVEDIRQDLQAEWEEQQQAMQQQLQRDAVRGGARGGRRNPAMEDRGKLHIDVHWHPLAVALYCTSRVQDGLY